MIYVAVSGMYVGADAFTLAQLEAQDDRDFTVVFLDPGWDVGVEERLEAFSAKTSVPVIRVPYRMPPGGRCFDWGIWNSPFLLAESEDDYILRLQSWRACSANLVAELRRKNASVGFGRRHTETPSAITGRIDRPTWRSEPCGIRGAYGDWFLRVGDFLTLNGIDEPATMLFHFEDIDMELRWWNGLRHGHLPQGFACEGLLYYVDPEARQRFAGAMTHKSHSDKRLTRPCGRCAQQWPELQASNNPLVRLDELDNRDGMEDLGVYFGKHWFHCRRCDAPLFHVGSPHFTVMHYASEHRATIGLLGKFGRNLRLARKRCLEFPPDERPQYVADSYSDPEVLRE